jgi:hypothetical protein
VDGQLAVWQSDPAGLVVEVAPKKESVVRSPLKPPHQKIIVPPWVEDAVREALDRDGDMYRAPLRVDILAAEIGAAEEVVRRAVKIRYEEREG